MVDARTLVTARWRVAALVAFLAGACLVGGAPASADRGVALNLGKVEVTDGLLAGGSYRLPVFGVRNPGSERTTYRMVVSYVRNQKRLEPPKEWFAFQPSEFSLRPGEARRVQVGIHLPTDSDPGDYETLLGAQIVTEAKGVQVGAAAASRVSFTVEPSSALEAWWLKAREFFSEYSPWSYLFPTLALIVFALWQLRRRVTFSVARRA